MGYDNIRAILGEKPPFLQEKTSLGLSNICMLNDKTIPLR